MTYAKDAARLTRHMQLTNILLNKIDRAIAAAAMNGMTATAFTWNEAGGDVEVPAFVKFRTMKALLGHGYEVKRLADGSAVVEWSSHM